MPGHWIGLTRLGVFCAVPVFAIIVLGLGADWIAVTEDEEGGYFDYAALAVATAVLTLVTMPAMLIIDFLRRGAFTSMILVEIVWLGILWVLWLTTGSFAANQLGDVSSCNSAFFPQWAKTGCSETQAIIAFAFLAWIALVAYWTALLTVAAISANKGSPRVWYTSVKEANFAPSTAKVDLTGAMGTAEHKGAVANASPAMQQDYPPAPHPVGPQHGYQPTQM
ncbi:uncharacterized protein PHACADRAFT_249914 [Phanerochaete carnosa HHB-10118-sp]|uniref:MARVEL domain-containing protein n=1 Tax=Phanerochaete carnosa (strain HHB-10118-sp) TaxID=650164 RepID=K5WJ73_PHACS|nr:uncharacterized protein PHACADRAFT_249914 [Phanerochaete carnosa HHB-10118-sp]EKM59430.1 hypothetical protein PHACADRAFT_249914 [Phanerochaete carnosa HHB-10118-sp]